MSICAVSKIKFYTSVFFLFVIFNTSTLIVSAQNTTDQMKNIFFRLYNRNVSNYKDELIPNMSNLFKEMDESKPTVMYMHGYTEDVMRESVLTVMGAYLERDDHNVIAVDWSEVAKQNYLRVATSVSPVGKYIAIGIKNMESAGFMLNSCHLVAHSMGAHVAGEVCRELKRKNNETCERIVALDPAGPLFDVFPVSVPLGPNDANFVHVIHTDKGVYGISRSIGTADFYPNNGARLQPNCPLIYALMSKEDFCSHHQSWMFYSKSVKDESAFMGTKCSYMQPIGEPVVMGYGTPLHAKGDYSLVTASTPSFGLGKDGAKC